MIIENAIFGGGISGLYIWNELGKKNKSTHLFEKKGRIGGRIKSINEFNKKIDEEYWYDTGANRINQNHKRVFKLVKELGLDDKWIKYEDKIDFYFENKKGINQVNFEKFKYLKENKNLVEAILLQLQKKVKNKKELINFTTDALIGEYFSPQIRHLSKIYHGYNCHFEKSNCQTFINYKHNIKNPNFYTLNGGLSQIINKLYDIGVKSLSQKLIHLGEGLLDFDWFEKKGLFRVKTDKRYYWVKNLILCLPAEVLIQIPYFEKKYYEMGLLNSVSINPYVRVFQIYPKKNGKVWFDDLNIVINDTLLKKIIPIDKEKGLIQISYCDGIYADYMINASANHSVEDYIHSQLKILFPKRFIPKPIETKVYYWRAGTHFWKPTYDEKEYFKKIIEIGNDKHLYIAGESFSKNQGWIEGALETSQLVLSKLSRLEQDLNKAKIERKVTTIKQISKNIIKRRKKKENPKKYTLSEVAKHNKETDAWLVIDGKVLDVTKWIPHHPGGLAIMAGVGKDATELFKQVGHSQYAWNLLRKYQIGNLKK